MKKFHISLLMVGLLVVGGLKARDNKPLFVTPTAEQFTKALIIEGAVEAIANQGDGVVKELNPEFLEKLPLTKQELMRLAVTFGVEIGGKAYNDDRRPELNDLKDGGKSLLSTILVVGAHKAYAKVAELTGAPRDTILKGDDSLVRVQKFLLNILFSHVAGEFVERFTDR